MCYINSLTFKNFFFYLEVAQTFLSCFLIFTDYRKTSIMSPNSHLNDNKKIIFYYHGIGRRLKYHFEKHLFTYFYFSKSQASLAELRHVVGFNFNLFYLKKKKHINLSVLECKLGRTIKINTGQVLQDL